jgi:hypothetical protein
MDAKLPPLVVPPVARKWLQDFVQQSKRGVVTTTAHITPERASALLEANPENRAVNHRRLQQMAGDMRNGLFKFNGESIIVADNGYLNDGQHRLWACVLSGQPFQSTLVVGVPRATRLTVDTGGARTAAAHLRISGHVNSTTKASVARYVCGWLEDGNFSKRFSVSVQNQLEQVNNDPLLEEVAAWANTNQKRLKSMLTPSLAGFMHYVLSVHARAEARVFMDQLALGADLAATNPIFLARTKLLQGVSNRGRLTELQRIELVVRAWNHWCVTPDVPLTRIPIMDTIPPIRTPRPLSTAPASPPVAGAGVPPPPATGSAGAGRHAPGP